MQGAQAHGEDGPLDQTPRQVEEAGVGEPPFRRRDHQVGAAGEAHQAGLGGEGAAGLGEGARGEGGG